jgi:dihydropteroate synthase
MTSIAPASFTTWWPQGRQSVDLGSQTFDITTKALVMGILNRTRDSFFQPAATFDLDAFLVRAESLVAAGADLLDVGGVKAGPGDEVSEQEELDRVVPAIAALRERFDLPLSIDTWRASVAEACFSAGACVGNDISGFGDPNYLHVAAAAGATVVATHIRLKPRVADPSPEYDDVTATVRDFLETRQRWALAAGIAPSRIIVDAGLDLGKTAAQSLQLLRDSATLAGLGPLLLSASNKTFLGVMFDLGVLDRRDVSLAATSMGIIGGCRILRVHDVQGTVRVRDALSRVLEAR